MSAETKSKRVYYGTFLGVFTPSILTIFGAIMYLRFGWVVGNAGVFSTLLIVVLANIITLITAFSVSSLATSMRVGVEGAYFLISRSLELEAFETPEHSGASCFELRLPRVTHCLVGTS